jgi:hypothetical protein
VSDNYIILIPQAPTFIPTAAAIKKSVALFKKLAPKADEIKSETTDHPRFIDCGENFQSISCPKCGANLDNDWWQDWMSEEAEADFPLRPATLPCCAAKVTLNDLKYDWPQGFARFSLEAMNPNIPGLTPVQITEFESILGCPLRNIFRHI